ncbi:TetR/AcrR family transcriptional regulator [Sphingobium yanoikuyae]|uniref:TetR/AcrR family transcriptional regulator n=1 Tax=Sphingobium yanoikuyae TaxID=13690 RepID=UPI001F371D70|nr:TetR/AcrR family transcriptional regulator [Sphingobium yanoikuyae]
MDTPISDPRPAAGRPTRAQAQARQAEMLDAALDMFLDKGFELTTMEAVAAAVGMTKRTIYARYPDKAALFMAAVGRAIARTATPRAALEAIAGEDLETILVAIARLRIADLSTPEGVRLRRIITTESYRFPDLLMLSYSQGAQPVHDHLADLLRRHDSAGAICVDRPDMAASLFMTMVLGGPIRLVGSPQPMSAAMATAAPPAPFLNGMDRTAPRTAQPHDDGLGGIGWGSPRRCAARWDWVRAAGACSEDRRGLATPGRPARGRRNRMRRGIWDRPIGANYGRTGGPCSPRRWDWASASACPPIR